MIKNVLKHATLYRSVANAILSVSVYKKFFFNKKRKNNNIAKCLITLKKCHIMFLSQTKEYLILLKCRLICIEEYRGKIFLLRS